MSEIDSGGFVYPIGGGEWAPDRGITRRDLGAIEIAAAMAAAVRVSGHSPDPGEIAAYSYELSDALIAEGGK